MSPGVSADTFNRTIDTLRHAPTDWMVRQYLARGWTKIVQVAVVVDDCPSFVIVCADDHVQARRIAIEYTRQSYSSEFVIVAGECADLV